MTPNTLAIQALYVAYFNRPADPRGLEYWEGVVAAQGGSTAAVSAEFAKSNEYKSTYAGMDNFSIVAKVYDNLFGRAGDLPGVNYWTKQLDSGLITIDNVVAAISAGALTTDKETVENRAAGAAKFTEALDTVDEIRAYATAAGGQVGRSFLSTITTDQSLADNTSAAALTSVTNQLLNSLPATTTNLTAGIDNLPGTTGNDVFNAFASSVLTDGSDANTLGSNDVIDGGAGNDTLNIEAIAGKNEVQTGTIRNIETINIINNTDRGGLFGRTVLEEGEELEEGDPRGTIDASKFVGATAVWQQNDAVDVTGLGTTTTAGFRNVTTDGLSVAATGATATVALDAVAGDDANLVSLEVSGSKLATVAVSGAVVKADADGADAKFALNVVTGVNAVTVNAGLATTLTVAKAEGATGEITTVNAAGSTGAVKFEGQAAQSSITGGSAADELTLATVFSTSVKAATVNGGAGNDTITVTVTNEANNATGVTATANGGEGNDTIKLIVTNGATNAVNATVDGGAGDDIVHILSDAETYRALSDNDTVTGGEGTDTIVVGSDSATLDSGDYVRLQDLAGFEIVRFGNEVGTGDEAVLAGELSKFTSLEFMEVSKVTGVAATQKLVAYDDLTASTAGYASSGSDRNNNAAAADVTVKGSADVTVNAKSVALTVDTTEAKASVEANLLGDLDSATAVLKSTVGTDEEGDDVDFIASLNIETAKFVSLSVTGTGSVTVDNSAEGSKLATIDTSALTGTNVDGDAFAGLTFTGNAALKETITLGAGVDNLTINSTAGGTSLSLVDTITGFNIDVDTLTVDAEGTFKAFTFDKAPASIGAALNTASASAEDAVVFTFGGNTYVFVETAGTTVNGNFEAGDIVVRLTGTYDLDDLAAHLNGPAT